MNEPTKDAYLDILKGDEVVRHWLRGPGIGYSIELTSDIVRVWDRNYTRLTSTRHLIELCIHNSELKRR